MNKRKICLMMILCLMMMPISKVRAFAAEADDDIYNIEFNNMKYLDGNSFYLSGEEESKISPFVRSLNTVCIADIQYNVFNNLLQLNYEISNGVKTFNASTYGSVYLNISVNAEQSLIADMHNTGDVSIVYLELYKNLDNTFVKMIVEENATGDVFVLENSFDKELFDLIYDNAYDVLSNEDYFRLVTDLGNSPNYSGIYSNNPQIYEVSGSEIVKVNDMSEHVSQQRVNEYNSRAEWKRLFDDFNKSSSFNVSNYNVDQTFFTSLNTNTGEYQWKTYDGGFSYQVIRVAYYQPTTNTYSFFLTLLNGEMIGTGRNLNLEFGMTRKETESSSQFTSCRAELNKQNKTLRYVTDRGIKVKPTISIGEIDKNDSSNRFTKVQKQAEVKSYGSGAISLLKMALGLIPKYNFGTVYTIADTLYNLYANPEVSGEIWEGSTIYNSVSLKSYSNSTDLYTSGDYYCINAYTSANQEYYRAQWNYTVYLP